ncbi:MAG: NAD(P)H-hydrate epimerase [Mogibacterium sp.]|nr:NAD(P)H-hydrate epimerase [Mogibacterium sp.]
MKDKVVSVDQMRRSDAYTIEHFVPGKELMYRAAQGVFDSYDGWAGRSIAIVTGGGNNGGDGYALAGILKNQGIEPVVYRVSDKLSDDGLYYLEIATDLGVPVRNFDEETDFSGYDVIVDCILGTGFKGEVRGKAADAIKAINASDAYVISVDINSGMNGDTGEAHLAVMSDLTVSIGYYKQGLFKGDADKYIGKLTNVDIGIVLID